MSCYRRNVGINTNMYIKSFHMYILGEKLTGGRTNVCTHFSSTQEIKHLID